MCVPYCIVVQKYTIFSLEGQHREQAVTEGYKAQADGQPWATRPYGNAALTDLGEYGASEPAVKATRPSASDRPWH